MPDNFNKLIVRYADGRKICNCGEAYQEPCMRGIKDGVERCDLMGCKHGCSANQIEAKEYIAKRVISDLGG
jgi:hypothetical protein